MYAAISYQYQKWQNILSSLTVLVLIASFLVGIQAAYADDATRESITMSPTSVKFTIDAGKSQQGKLTIVNDGTTDYDFLVYARPYSIQDNHYDNPNFTAVTSTADLYQWVQFPQTKYHLQANKTVDVNYVVNVPSGAAPGGHYGVIFAEVQPSPASGSGNTITTKKRIGAIMYATVNGAVNLSGEPTGITIPFWQVEPPLHATAAAKNTGNTHFTDTLQLTVSDLFGNIKYQTSKDYPVLPQTTRTMSLDWATSPWFGLYKVKVQQKFLDKSAMSEGYVLMMPRYIPVIFVVILLVGGVYAAARRRKK